MKDKKKAPPLFWQTGQREIPPRPDKPESYPPEDERHWFDQEYAGWHREKYPQPPSPADGPKGKTVIALGSDTHPYSKDFRRGMTETAEKFGIRFSYYDCQWDADLQEEQLLRALQLKPDLIILCAENTLGSTAMFRKIYEAGIPVIASNEMPREEGFPYLLSWTGPDNWGQFRLLARRFAELMNHTGGYAIVCHRQETSHYHARSWSAITELKKAAPGMELLEMASTDLNREKTYKKTREWIETYGSALKGIISADDNIAQLGINQALAESGREDIIRVANGTTPAGIRFVLEGSLQAITYQLPEQDGALPVRVAADWFNGLEIAGMNVLPVRLLDRQNIGPLLSEPADAAAFSPDYLYQMIMERRPEEVEGYFAQTARDFSRDRHMTMDVFRGYCMEILSNLMNITKTMQLPSEDIIGSSDSLFKQLFQQPTMDRTLGWLKEISLTLIRRLSGLRQKQDSLIQQVVEYAGKNSAEPLSLKTLAYRYNISPAYLGRLFKEETGESFPAWLNRIRMEEAETLMRTTGLTATQIALKVGYGSPNYFFNLFKRHKGMNPRAYMASLAEKTYKK